MAIQQEFDGLNIIEAGVYGARSSGDGAISPTPTYGNALIIDTSGVGASVGSGIDGENYQGKRAIQTYGTKQSFQSRVRQGLMYDLATPIFDPQANGTANGVDSLSYIQAAKTRAARIPFAFSGGFGGGARGTANLRVVTATIPSGLGGTGYAVSDTITLAGGTFSTAAVLTVASIGVGGTIATLTITNAGVYTVAPTGNATQGSTSGAGVGAQFSLSFGLNAIQITAGGTGYTTAPQVRFIGDGTGAVGTSTLTSTAVSSATVTTAGTGYTRAASVYFVAVNGNGGEFVFRTLVEGDTANGFETSGLVTRGFGVRLSVGVVDTSKFILTFLKGTFTGLDADGIPYNGIAEVDTTPEVLAVSDEFSTYEELLDWTERSTEFKNWFVREAQTKFGTGVITTSDLAANVGNILAVQGSQVFGATYVDMVLDSLVDFNFDFILCMDFGATSNGSQSVNNTKIYNFVKSIKNKNLPQIYIAGGSNKTEFTASFGSISTAEYFNDESVTVVHGSIQINGVRGLRTKNALYNAAMLLGTEANLPPQTPLTKKPVSVKSVVHDLSESERITALQKGVVHLRLLNSNWVVAQGINSMGEPKNKQLIWQDGTSYEKSMRRIDSAILKDIRTQAEALGFAGGGNRNTASPEKVKSFLEGYLQSVTSSATIDSLIITYRNVQVQLVEDCNKATFEIVKNSPVNKLYFRVFTLSNITV